MWRVACGVWRVVAFIWVYFGWSILGLLSDVDHRLVFHGYLRPAPPKPARGAPVPDFAQTVLFTDNPLLIAREAENVYNHR
jgi:hypothetical protein